MKQIVPLIFFLLIFSNVVAQDFILQGKVTDSADDTPLAGVNILVKGTYIGTITDQNGNFKLTSSKYPPFTITVSMIGYTSVELDITKNTSDLLISLEESYIIGQGVVVSRLIDEEK